MPRKPGEKIIAARKRKADASRVDQYRKYDYFQRNPETAEKYNSVVWRKCRAAYIAEHPICEECEVRGRTVLAVEVHHRIPLSDGGSLTDENNLESLCHSCHMAIHGFKGSGEGELNVVYDAPCSGKTTWVEAQFKPGDFVWDMDQVLSAVSKMPLHSEVSDGHLEVVLAMRDAAFNQLRRHDSRVSRAWVIITNPTKLRFLFNGATFWRMNTSRAVCLERARVTGRSKVVIDAIGRWFVDVEARPGDRGVGG